MVGFLFSTQVFLSNQVLFFVLDSLIVKTLWRQISDFMGQFFQNSGVKTIMFFSV